MNYAGGGCVYLRETFSAAWRQVALLHLAVAIGHFVTPCANSASQGTVADSGDKLENCNC